MVVNLTTITKIMFFLQMKASQGEERIFIAAPSPTIVIGASAVIREAQRKM
ncbi:MAG: hypothetical protein JW798_18220 [Prolixibacteraceae bacterium]|nr:hypothetical protein [Prolixibacteraceae bacterium]